MLLPSPIEDYVSEYNSVHAIDAYVDALNLPDLGFKQVGAVSSMYPPIHLIYAHVNAILGNNEKFSTALRVWIKRAFFEKVTSFLISKRRKKHKKKGDHHTVISLVLCEYQILMSIHKPILDVILYEILIH
jgi:hypothetical protein